LWRDAIDRGIAESVRKRAGKIIDSQEELRDENGKLPGIDDLPLVKRPEGFDADQDGMADDFERSHGLNPADPEDAKAATLSREGYTNLEVYLNQLVPAADAVER
jgi:hypothetical protein